MNWTYIPWLLLVLIAVFLTGIVVLETQQEHITPDTELNSDTGPGWIHVEPPTRINELCMEPDVWCITVRRIGERND